MGETVGVGRLLGGAVASVATTTSASTKVGNEAMNEATIARWTNATEIVVGW